jgi:hypothetical protein
VASSNRKEYAINQYVDAAGECLSELKMLPQVICKFFSAQPAKILFCGISEIALELARMGHLVDVVAPPSQEPLIEIIRSESQKISVHISIESDTYSLSKISDETYEVIILHGHFFQGVDENSRRKNLIEAKRILCANGLLFILLVNFYGAIEAAVKNEVVYQNSNMNVLKGLKEMGVFERNIHTKKALFDILSKPRRYEELCWQTRFEVEGTISIGKWLSLIEKGFLSLQDMDEIDWEKLFDPIQEVPDHKSCSQYFLLVAKKPAWQPVLKSIVNKLNSESIQYNVVGGTSVALQGVPIKVKDIDLEMSRESIYRFQDLFQDEICQAVVYCEDLNYSSFLGKFEFECVPVEIFADLKRREKGRWVDTCARTSREIDLDTVKICASWLEEETIAYIRRGRMARAALCIAQCDQARMLSLLRGEVEIGVI